MPRPRHGVTLALTAVAYNLCHHVGTLPDGLGSATHGTRVADWIDLAAPFLVLVPALLTLVAAQADRAAYAVFVIGALLYTQGHGVHLAANSIGNAAPGPTAHFWDETAGHVLWYAGVAVVAVALARTMAGRGRPSPAAWVAALATGLTWGSNAVGADLALVGLVPALVAVWWGWRHRSDEGVLLAIAGVAAVALVGAAVALGEA